MEKSSWAIFSAPAQLYTDPQTTTAREASPLPRVCLTCQLPLNPIPLLCSARVATPAKLLPTSQPPITTPHHKDSRVFACHLEPSRRLWCVVVAHRRCPPASALIDAAPVGFWSRPLGDEVLEQPASLAKLQLPKA
jgi:hypothetical protein